MAGITLTAGIELKTDAIKPMIDALKAVIEEARSEPMDRQRIISLCEAAGKLFAESLEVRSA